MKGFIIYHNKTGQLVYSKYYTEGQKFSKQHDQTHLLFDGQDPRQVASHFFALGKMAEMMVEEFKMEFEAQYENDVNTKMALGAGFRSFKSDAVDYFLDHHEKFPLTIVLFYDSQLFSEQIMKGLTTKILDIFVYKYEKKFEKGKFSIKQGKDANSSTLSEKSYTTFEQALSLIYEDTLVEWVKMIFVDLSSQNILIPWVYLFYNDEFCYEMKAGSGEKAGPKKGQQNSTASRSDLNYRGASSGQQGVNTGLGNVVNSNINESELELEFGYCTEEESVFQSFN